MAILTDTAAALKALRWRVLVLGWRVGVVGLAGVVLWVVGSMQRDMSAVVGSLRVCALLGLWHTSLRGWKNLRVALGVCAYVSVCVCVHVWVCEGVRVCVRVCVGVVL